MSSELLQWVIIPVLIMSARILDVSIGTLRIVYVSRERGRIAAILGFFEVIIWLVAITQVLQNLTNVACYIAYGLGFALGNVIGVHIEKKIAVGTQIVRIITCRQVVKLQEQLRHAGYGVTTVDGQGTKGPVHIIYIVTKRKNTHHVLQIVDTIAPKSFVTVQDVGMSQAGFFAPHQRRFKFLSAKKI